MTHERYYLLWKEDKNENLINLIHVETERPFLFSAKSLLIQLFVIYLFFFELEHIKQALGEKTAFLFLQHIVVTDSNQENVQFILFFRFFSIKKANVA